MSYVVVTPDLLSTAAADLESIGLSVRAANSAAAVATT
ncbi:PE family protein, partial [Mycobacterium intermedium]